MNKSASLPTLENQLAQTQKEIDNVMNAIKAGIITPTTKDTLMALEEEKSNLEISIAKEKIERPVLTREQIKFWLCKFGSTDLSDMEQKQRLINVFVNSIYVYDDRMVVTFNYKDNDKAMTFDEITEMQNADNLNDYQRSPLDKSGDP